MERNECTTRMSRQDIETVDKWVYSPPIKKDCLVKLTVSYRETKRILEGGEDRELSEVWRTIEWWNL